MTAKSGRSPHSTKPPAKPPVDLLLVSAVTFLTLCVWIGPSRTLLFLMIAAALVVWFWLIRRFPGVGVALLGFLRGLLGR